MSNEKNNAGTAIQERKDVEDIFKWRTEDIYPSNEDWEAAFESLKKDLPRIASFKGQLKESAK